MFLVSFGFRSCRIYLLYGRTRVYDGVGGDVGHEPVPGAPEVGVQIWVR